MSRGFLRHALQLALSLADQERAAAMRLVEDGRLSLGDPQKCVFGKPRPLIDGLANSY